MTNTGINSLVIMIKSNFEQFLYTHSDNQLLTYLDETLEHVITSKTMLEEEQSVYSLVALNRALESVSSMRQYALDPATKMDDVTRDFVVAMTYWLAKHVNKVKVAHGTKTQ